MQITEGNCDAPATFAGTWNGTFKCGNNCYQPCGGNCVDYLTRDDLSEP